MAVLLIDLDHFKSINDRFGHAIGDKILQMFAETSSAKLGPRDLIGRLGGEEFAIVLHDTTREGALAAAERVRSTFAEAAAMIDGCLVHSTVSIGVVVEQDGSVEMPVLLSQADQALYYAKARGRNRVEVASLDLVQDRAKLKTSIKVAQVQTAA